MKKSIFLLLFIVGLHQTSNVYSELLIRKFFTRFFSNELVKTERMAYETIKRARLPINTTYLAVPWEALAHYKSKYPGKLYAAVQKLSNLRIHGGFTVVHNLSWNAKILLPLFEKIGIDCVFTPCTLTTKPFKDISKKIKVIPLPYYAMNGVDPSPTKDVLYSFIGSTPVDLISHHVRETIFSMDHAEHTVIKRRKHFLCPSGADEFRDILARSRYSICPPGNLPLPEKTPTGIPEPGVMRFYESLKAGAIPIFINDLWELPYGFDWDRCMVRVREADVLRIPEIIASITPEEETAMREACYEAYAMFSDDNYISPIKRHYGIK